MTYAIIALGGKQYRVQEGQRLLVDRLPYDETNTFQPDVLFLGGNGTAELSPKGAQVTVRVVKHLLGDKILIGKYKPKKGYKKHIGHRSRLSQIQVDAITASPPAKPRKAAAKPAAEKKAATKPAPAKATSARSKPKASALREKAS